MSSDNIPGWLIWAILAAAVLYFTWLRTPWRSQFPLPPGPKRLPLLGNVFDDMSVKPWETWMEWSKRYNSDIIHLNLAGTSIIVLSSLEATNALLEKRSSIYSDRPTVPMLGDLMGWNYMLSFMKYGNEWRTDRRLFNQEFTTGVAAASRPRQRFAAHELLRRLVSNPDGFLDHLRQMAGETIMAVTYGIDVLPADDPYIALAEKGMEVISKCGAPGKFLVDLIPILKYVPEWVPGAKFQRIAREGRKLAQDLRDLPFNETKRRMALGGTPTSFTANALRNLQTEDQYYQEDSVKNVAATMYVAGADTTVSALSTFFLAMLANPDAQKKAQIEIDSVVEQGNLPDFSDEEAMPYIAALVKEVLRWRNVTPLAAPHFLPVEDEYRGYRLPAGSRVFGNSWAILHDEKMYPDPYAFKPERFLLDGKPNPAVKDPQAAFGFGRRSLRTCATRRKLTRIFSRICPGRHMATSSIWIAVVSILAVFDINKEIGEDGQTIEPSYEYQHGLVSNPVPFKCSITPRFKDTVSLIQSTSMI
ncbi:cytochrome P450 [Mycena galericulata]|nr:cytochrome P450 [Mycena galericulata]